MESIDSKKLKKWVSIMEFGHRLGCHQRAERSFFFKGYQFPVCARCTGVIIGELIAIILLFCGLKSNIYISIALLLVMGLDWFIQYIKLKESNNIRRLITGISGGIGLIYIYYYVIMFIIEFFS